jgi:hypothetical protein
MISLRRISFSGFSRKKDKAAKLHLAGSMKRLETVERDAVMPLVFCGHQTDLCLSSQSSVNISQPFERSLKILVAISSSSSDPSTSSCSSSQGNCPYIRDQSA